MKTMNHILSSQKTPSSKLLIHTKLVSKDSKSLTNGGSIKLPLDRYSWYPLTVISHSIPFSMQTKSRNQAIHISFKKKETRQYPHN